MLVKKRNGEDRMCVDYRELNSITERQPFPMPVFEKLFAMLAGNKYFTSLDLMSGYYQIPVEPESQKYTAFVTHDGHYEFTRMPFGLVNVPSVFQSCMNELQIKLPPGDVAVYLDDTIIPSVTVEEGLEKLKRILGAMKECGLTLRLNKCVFLSEHIKFLGHNVSENGIMPGDDKVASIRQFPEPTDLHTVRRFLGLTGFFRKFVRNYYIAKPLTQLLKTVNNPIFIWGREPAVNSSDIIIHTNWKFWRLLSLCSVFVCICWEKRSESSPIAPPSPLPEYQRHYYLE